MSECKSLDLGSELTQVRRLLPYFPHGQASVLTLFTLRSQFRAGLCGRPSWGVLHFSRSGAKRLKFCVFLLSIAITSTYQVVPYNLVWLEYMYVYSVDMLAMSPQSKKPDLTRF